MYLFALYLLDMFLFWLFSQLFGVVLYLLIVTIGRLFIYWQVTLPTTLLLFVAWKFGLMKTIIGLGIGLLIFVLCIAISNLDSRDKSKQN